MWWEYLLVFGAGFFAGALVMSLCAMARCGDCEITERIRREVK